MHRAKAPQPSKGVLTPDRLRAFEASLSKTLCYEDWLTHIKPGYERQIANLKRELAEARSAPSFSAEGAKDRLKASFEAMLMRMTPEKLEELLNNGAAMRVMAQIAGIDLTEKPLETVGPGAELIIIRPHPGLLTAEEEADVVRQIKNRQ